MAISLETNAVVVRRVHCSRVGLVQFAGDALTREKVLYAVHKQQRPRSACASMSLISLQECMG